MSETHPLAERSALTIADVLDETFPGIVDWCDPGWLGYWGLDAYRGSPARRTDDAAVTTEEVASIVASGRAVTTVPEASRFLSPTSASGRSRSSTPRPPC